MRPASQKVESYEATWLMPNLVGFLLLFLVLTVVVWRAGSSLLVSLLSAVPLLAFLCWIAYSYLVLIASRLLVSRGRLEWHAPLAHGERSIDDLVSIWSRWPRNGVVQFRFRDGSKVSVVSGKGFHPFARQLVTDFPHVRLDTSILDHR